MNYLLFSHLLEQSKPLTLVTLDILHFRHFGCGFAALGILLCLIFDFAFYELFCKYGQHITWKEFYGEVAYISYS